MNKTPNNFEEEDQPGLLFLDEILATQELLTESNQDNINNFKKKPEAKQHKNDLDELFNVFNKKGKDNIVDVQDQKKKKLDTIMKDYNVRINKEDIKIYLSNIEQENKIKEIYNSKYRLIGELKDFKKEKQFFKDFKKQDQVKKPADSNGNEFYSNMKKKTENRLKRNYNRGLKFKKQKKKKVKISKNFLKFQSLGYVPKNLFINFVDIIDWRGLLEKQVNVIFDKK